MTELELIQIAERTEAWFNDSDRPMFFDPNNLLFAAAETFATDIGNLLSHIGSQDGHIAQLEQALREAYPPRAYEIHPDYPIRTIDDEKAGTALPTESTETAAGSVAITPTPATRVVCIDEHGHQDIL